MVSLEPTRESFKATLEEVYNCKKDLCGNRIEDLYKYFLINFEYISEHRSLCERVLIYIDKLTIGRMHHDLYKIINFCERIGIVENLPLHRAVKKQKIDKLNKLLAKGCDPNEKDCFYETPLFYAVSEDNLEMAKILAPLTSNIRESSIRSSRCNVLHIAAMKGNREMVELLIAYGCRPTDLNCDNYDILDLAVERGHLGLASWIYNENLATGKHAFDIACASGKLELVIFVWSYIRPKLTEFFKANKKRTIVCLPCLEAIRRGYVDIVEYLISQQVPILGKDDDGNTALHSAALSGNRNMLKLILKHMALQPHMYSNNEGKTPLMIAMEKDDPTLVALLLEKIPDEHLKIKEQETINLALKKEFTEVVEYLGKI